MPLETWAVFVVTVLTFMITPGPSHLLMLSNSMTHGFRPSLATAAGDLVANALQMLAAGLGLAALLAASHSAMTVVKWLGVAYLLWMGIRMWRSSHALDRQQGDRRPHSLRVLWLQGFMTSAANPKAVVFFAALFPQFIDPERPFLAQFLALSLTYLAIDGLFLSGYGAGAGWLAARLKARAGFLMQRMGGAFLIAAAVLLGAKTLTDER
ncbi:MAG: LysE family translocator [Pseudomonadota bacterium]